MMAGLAVAAMTEPAWVIGGRQTMFIRTASRR